MTPPPLRLLSSMAAREVLREMAALHASRTSQVVICEAAGGVDVARRIRDGEALDIAVLAGNVIEQLIAEGRLAAGSRVDLVDSGIAIAVRAGGPAPRIETESQVRDAVAAARSVSFSTGPSGAHLEKLFERWGILGAIRDRIVVPPPGIPVATLVADGAAELGFQQLSELMNVSGVEVVGPLPPALQSLTTFAGAISARCAAPAAAREVLAFMASPATAALKRRNGMEPAAARG